MSRLIDADKLLDDIRSHSASYFADDFAREWVDKQPIVDAVPVRHGRWIKYIGMGKVQWMCSECSAEEKNPKIANWCYHCGARMDSDD